MKNKLRKFIPLVAVPSFVVLASSCDSDTPLGQQNNVIGNAEFTIPETLAAGDEFNIKSFVLTRPLDLTFSMESGSTLSYNDSRFPDGVGPYVGIPFTYTTLDKTRTLLFEVYNDFWDTNDDKGTTQATLTMPDPESDDTNILEDLLKAAAEDDDSIVAAAIAYADTTTKENAQVLLEALSANEDLRAIDMVFDRQGTRISVLRSVQVVFQVDGSSNFSNVGVPLSVSLLGVITRGGDVSVNIPTGYTFTSATATQGN